VAPASAQLRDSASKDFIYPDAIIPMISEIKIIKLSIVMLDGLHSTDVWPVGFKTVICNEGQML